MIKRKQRDEERREAFDGAFFYGDPLKENAVFSNLNNFHSIGTYFNRQANVFLKRLQSFDNGALDFYHQTNVPSIIAVNHPFPQSAADATGLAVRKKEYMITAGCLALVLALAFFPAAVVSYLVIEKDSSFKFQQFVSGASPLAYWVANFVFDLSFSLVPLLVMLLLFYSFEFIPQQNILSLSAFLGLYAVANIGFTHVLSFLFSKPTAAANASLFINVGTCFAGIAYKPIATAIVLLMRLTDENPSGPDDITLSNVIINWVPQLFKLVPNFTIVQVVSYKATSTVENEKSNHRKRRIVYTLLRATGGGLALPPFASPLRLFPLRLVP